MKFASVAFLRSWSISCCFASLCSFPREKLTFFLVNLIRGSAISANLGTFLLFGKEEKFSITLEFDGVLTSNGLSLLAVLLTNRTGSSVFLDLVDIGKETHTATYIAEVVYQSFLDTKLDEELLNVVISDEAANCKKARSLLIDKFTSKHLMQYRCLAHVVNLIGSTVSKSFPLNVILQKLTTLVHCVNRHKKLMKVLQELGANKIVNAVPTRWYSTCAMINSVLKLRSLFNHLPRNDELQSNVWAPIIDNDGFWIGLEAAKIYFNRLSSIIGLAESSDSYLSVVELGCFVELLGLVVE